MSVGYGRWLFVARVAWVVDALFALGIFAVSIVGYLTGTNLQDLDAHLVAVVRETMQPSHAPLWLRDAGR